MLRDPRGLALILGLLVASFSYSYAYAAQPGQGGALGAFTPMEPDESLKACGFASSKPIFILSGPSKTRIVLGELSVEARLAPMDACVSGDLAAIAGSQDGRPAILVVRGSKAWLYTIPAWGIALSVDCRNESVAFTAATYTKDLIMGIIKEGQAIIVDVPLFPGYEWSAKAAAAPWGAVAVAGNYVIYFNVTEASLRGYRLSFEGLNVTLEGAWAGQQEVLVYGKAYKGDLSMGFAWVVGEGSAFLVNSSSGRTVIKRSALWGSGVLAYYSPNTWWDGIVYFAKPSEKLRGVRLIHGYPHIVDRVDVHADGSLVIAVTDASNERSGVCIQLSTPEPLRLGRLGNELVTIQYIPTPERPSVFKAPPPRLHEVNLTYDIVNINASIIKVDLRPSWGYDLVQPQHDLFSNYLIALGLSIPIAAATHQIIARSLEKPNGETCRNLEGSSSPRESEG